MAGEVIGVQGVRITDLPEAEAVVDSNYMILVDEETGRTYKVKREHIKAQKTSELVDDVGFLRAIPGEYMTESEVKEFTDAEIAQIDGEIAQIKELTDAEIAQLREVLNTWETFKSNGGEIGGQIILPYGISLSGRASEDVPRDMIHIQRGGMITVGDQNNGLILTSKSRPQIWEESTPKLIVVNDDFPISKDTNGYTILPNGLIMQWGETPVFGTNGYTVLFPISFPNSTLTISVTPYTKNGFYSEAECKVGTKDKYAFNVWGNVDQRGLWIAIGY